MTDSPVLISPPTNTGESVLTTTGRKFTNVSCPCWTPEYQLGSFFSSAGILWLKSPSPSLLGANKHKGRSGFSGWHYIYIGWQLHSYTCTGTCPEARSGGLPFLLKVSLGANNNTFLWLVFFPNEWSRADARNALTRSISRTFSTTEGNCTCNSQFDKQTPTIAHCLYK